jgi:hypothetical protein
MLCCPKCGHEIPEGSHFCPSCGADLTKQGDGENITLSIHYVSKKFAFPTELAVSIDNAAPVILPSRGNMSFSISKGKHVFHFASDNHVEQRITLWLMENTAMDVSIGKRMTVDILFAPLDPVTPAEPVLADERSIHDRKAAARKTWEPMMELFRFYHSLRQGIAYRKTQSNGLVPLSAILLVLSLAAASLWCFLQGSWTQWLTTFGAVLMLCIILVLVPVGGSILLAQKKDMLHRERLFRQCENALILFYNAHHSDGFSWDEMLSLLEEWNKNTN